MKAIGMASVVAVPKLTKAERLTILKSPPAVLRRNESGDAVPGGGDSSSALALLRTWMAAVSLGAVSGDASSGAALRALFRAFRSSLTLARSLDTEFRPLAVPIIP